MFKLAFLWAWTILHRSLTNRKLFKRLFQAGSVEKKYKAEEQDSQSQPKLKQTPAYDHTPCSCTAKCLFPKHFTQTTRKPKALSPAGRAKKSDKYCPVNHMYCRCLETNTVFPELPLQCFDFLNSRKTATLKGVLFLLLSQNPTNSLNPVRHLLLIFCLWANQI